MHQPGFEPGSKAWKAFILAVGLLVPAQIVKNRNYKCFGMEFINEVKFIEKD